LVPQNIALLEFIGKPLFKHIVDWIVGRYYVDELVLIIPESSYTPRFELDMKGFGDVHMEKIQRACPEEILEAIDIHTKTGVGMIICFAHNIKCLVDDEERELGNGILLSDGGMVRVEPNTRITTNKLMAVIETAWDRVVRYPWEYVGLLEVVLEGIISTTRISGSAEISESANIIGPCWIDDGAKILENATIKGPCYIGRGVLVGTNALIRHAVVERSSIIGANMEVARSWLGVRTETHSGYIGDSIFDEMVHTGAGFITGNVRLDRSSIGVYWEGGKIDTGLRKLGAIIGTRTEIGIHSGTMPGVLIGKRVVIGPGTLIFRNVPDDTVLYVVQEVVRKTKLKK